MKRCPKVEEPLEKELKDINSALNRFLKQYFTIELDSLQEYLHNVKDLLIELTTKKMAPLLTNVFSKFSNILQPFTSYSYDLSLDSLKQEVAFLREQNAKLSKKINSLKNDLQSYRVRSNKATEFIYLLRVNNVNVDEIYRKGVMQSVQRIHQNTEELQPQLPRKGVELQPEDLLGDLKEQSSLTSQYVSVKSRR